MILSGCIFKPFFAPELRGPLIQLWRCCTEWKDKHEGQNMPLQMPHVSVCDSHSQSKYCVLAVLEQGKPSASAEFRTSMTSQRIISRLQGRSHTRIPQREKTHLPS